MEKVWSKEIENNIVKIWEQENINKKLNEIKGKIDIVFDTPPPYPAPHWHIGAALSYVYQDFVARIFRMFGKNVLFPIGIDRNGIAVEWYIQKYENIDLKKLSREEVIKIAKECLDKYSNKMIQYLKNFFYSADFDNIYFTDSEEYRALTQKTFIELFKKGLIYEKEFPILYCPNCQITIALSEVEREEKEGTLYYIKFKIKETNEEIVIATTRPELLEACIFIAYNPKDKRYKKLKNKHAIVPIFNFEVPIIERKEIDMNFGTGIMMICSYGDLDDVKILNELNAKPKIVIDKEGKYIGSIYNGLKLQEVREKIIEDLKKQGLIIKEEKIIQNVPLHDKCRSKIEILISKEFFLNQLAFKNDLIKIVKKMKVIPKEYKKRLILWIKNVSFDWPISRQRYYATEIPLWYCSKCKNVTYLEDGKYHRPWKEKIDKICEKCGNNEWIGEERTLDTWFDSSITILYLLNKYNISENVLKIRFQGYDIIRTWLYYSLLRFYQLKNELAFNYAIINGMGLDEHGRKMSKSLGNLILPEEVEKIGIDCTRLWFAMECLIGTDYRISITKIENMKAFLTKLLNIANFILQFKENYKKAKELKYSDKWILNEVKNLKKQVLNHYKKFEISFAVQKIYNFVWDIYASHYVELVKKRAYEKDESAIYTLFETFKEILKLLTPIIPATCDYIYRNLYDKSILLEKFGKIGKIEKELLEKGKKLIEFNSFVWKMKKERGLSLKDEIEIEIPNELNELKEDLIKMHNIKTKN